MSGSVVGTLPEGWRATPLKYLASSSGGMTPSKDRPDFWDGDIPWVSPKDMKQVVLADSADHVSQEALIQTGLRLHPPEGVMVVVRGMILAHTFPVARNVVPVTVNQDMKVLRPVKGVDSRYLSWMLQGLEPVMLSLTDESAHGTKALRTDQWANLVVPVPDGSAQERIANFLDEQTARIDALIAEKERLLQLIAEQRLSVAERVLAPAASELLVKLGFFVDLLPGFAFPSEEFSRDPEDIPLLRGVNVSPGGIRWDESVYWRRDYDASLERFKVREGDVILGMDRPWISSGARVAMVDASSDGALLLQRVCRLRGGERFHQRFLYFALASDSFRQSVEVELTGVSVPHISPEQILRFKVPALTPVEQAGRCASADAEVERLLALDVHTSAMLDSLREYRSSLISAAVTGQLDLGTFKEPA